MIQTLWIPLIPKPQGRPRAFVRGRHAGVYKDAKSRRYEDNLTAFLLSHYDIGLTRAERGTGVRLRLVFYLPRPQGHYGKQGLKERYAAMPHTSKPDLDNLVKAFKDSARGVIYQDDSQVYFLRAQKVYSDGKPGTMVEVSWG